MTKYVPKPLKVDAMLIDVDMIRDHGELYIPEPIRMRMKHNWEDDCKIDILYEYDVQHNRYSMFIRNGYGHMKIDDGDYVVMNPDGNLLRYSNSDFRAMYEEASEYEAKQKAVDVVKELGKIKTYLQAKYPKSRELSLIFTKLDEGMLWYQEMRKHNPMYEGDDYASKGE